MRSTNTSVADLIAGMEPWVNELMLLREIILSTGLKEEIKWGSPIYTLEGKNVLSIGGFKNFFTIWFHQGVFLKDPGKVLVNAGDGKTKGLRQWRFTSKDEIKPALVKKYILEAVKNAKAGKEIKPERKPALPLPEELKNAFKEQKQLKSCFEKLTPGRQREYIEYIAEARGKDTRMKRTAKAVPMILAGVGLNDRYK